MGSTTGRTTSGRTRVACLGSGPDGPSPAPRPLGALPAAIDLAASDDLSGADVVLFDAAGRTDGGVGDVSTIRRRTEAPILVLLDRADGKVLLRLLRLGVGGCLIRPVDPVGLAAALIAVESGEVVLDHDLAVRAAVLAARLVDVDRSPAELLGLSAREVQVLERLEGGPSAREIAAELFVSHETVRSHLKRIYRKLGVHDRAAAVRAAREDGVLGAGRS